MFSAIQNCAFVRGREINCEINCSKWDGRGTSVIPLLRSCHVELFEFCVCVCVFQTPLPDVSLILCCSLACYILYKYISTNGFVQEHPSSHTTPTPPPATGTHILNTTPFALEHETIYIAARLVTDCVKLPRPGTRQSLSLQFRPKLLFLRD